VVLATAKQPAHGLSRSRLHGGSDMRVEIQGDADLAVAEQVAHDLGKYVLVCLNQRPEGHPKGSCLDLGAADVFNALREEQGRRLLTNFKVVAAGCMEACLAGPALLVVPDNVWYGGVTEADVPALVEQHLIGGEAVELLRIGPEDFTG
jgi:(2Fe-2S) ferredoxin